MRVCKEELEGPLLPVVRFSSLTELPAVGCPAGTALIWSEKGGHAGWWGEARRNTQHDFFY
jgi:acyl-CoA reductase-like NAD-dependent aldehyde dehydrogenase